MSKIVFHQPFTFILNDNKKSMLCIRQLNIVNKLCNLPNIRISSRISNVVIILFMLSAFFKKIIAKMPSAAASISTPDVIVRMPRDRPSIGVQSNLVWIDCEMTGLEVEHHRLVEIASIITDSDLNILAEFGPITIKQPPEVMESMSDWCKKTFKENGLTNRILDSSITESQAEVMLLEFIKKYTKPKESPLAGNSVHMDKIFLMRYMPSIMEHLHYRIVDVSTVKELVKRWFPEKDLQLIPEKKALHLALDDIKESVRELKYYQLHFFKQSFRN